MLSTIAMVWNILFVPLSTSISYHEFFSEYESPFLCFQYRDLSDLKEPDKTCVFSEILLFCFIK